MAAKPETTFTLSVHRHLPPKELLHREKMNNPYHSGTADVWYSGPVKDLWVEYKFVQLPARAATRVAVDCSELQFEWLRGRRRDGRNVWVIVGCKAGGVVMRDLAWEASWTRADFEKLLLPREEVARQIHNLVGSHEPSTALYNVPGHHCGVPDHLNHTTTRLPRKKAARSNAETD